MGHILGSDIVPETAAVTAGTHPATFATGMLLVVFVSIVWKCFPSQWDAEGYFFLEKSRKTKKTPEPTQLPRWEKKKKQLCKRGGIDSVSVLLWGSSVSVQVEIMFGVNLGDGNW